MSYGSAIPTTMMVIVASSMVGLARLWKKPLFVFDQGRRSWFRWSGTAWEIVNQPVITAESFAGIGTQNLDDEGRAAIHDLFLRSFGDPSH